MSKNTRRDAPTPSLGAALRRSVEAAWAHRERGQGRGTGAPGFPRHRPRRTAVCLWCKQPYLAASRRTTGGYCSDAHRLEAWRAKHRRAATAHVLAVQELEDLQPALVAPDDVEQEREDRRRRAAGDPEYAAWAMARRHDRRAPGGTAPITAKQNLTCRKCGRGRYSLDINPVTGTWEARCRLCAHRVAVVLEEVPAKCPNCEQRRLAAIRRAFTTEEGIETARLRGRKISSWWATHPVEAEARRQRLRNMPRGPDGSVLPGARGE